MLLWIVEKGKIVVNWGREKITKRKKNGGIRKGGEGVGGKLLVYNDVV